jgi:WhiB family transcriptional regulator, redox-sensing transcriptional regulator
MTERERRALLRRRPNVTSWRLLLETAMADHVAAVSASTVVAATA